MQSLMDEKACALNAAIRNAQSHPAMDSWWPMKESLPQGNLKENCRRGNKG